MVNSFQFTREVRLRLTHQRRRDAEREQREKREEPQRHFSFFSLCVSASLRESIVFPDSVCGASIRALSSTIQFVNAYTSMKIPVSMRQIIYSQQQLNPHGPTIFFADDASEDAPVATEILEEALVTWLFADVRVRTVIAEELGLSEQVCWRTSVTVPFVQDSNRKPGDIDLLLVDPGRPQTAVAVETKRIKVRPGRDGAQTVTKLLDFSKGMRQANGLLDFGFCRTYLAMLAVVDGRDATDASFAFRGLQPDTMEKVLQTPGWDALRGEVGMLYVEIVQPVSQSVDQAGIIRLSILRDAHPREQSVETTSRIVRYFDLPS